MRSLFTALPMLVAIACETTPPAHPEASPVPAHEAAPPGPDRKTETHGTATATMDPMAQRLRARIREGLAAEFSDMDTEMMEIREPKLLGGVTRGDDRFVVFEARIETDGMALEELTLLVVAVPDVGDHRLLGFELGHAAMVPGSEESFEVESVEGLRVEHGVAVAQISLLSGLTEFDTCDDCQGRRVQATVRERRMLVCATPESCVLIPVAVEIAEPAYDVDENGNRRPPREDDAPAPWAIACTVEDNELVRMTVISGDVYDGDDKDMLVPFEDLDGPSFELEHAE